MKISTILDFIDNGFIALPEFQRGYVWNRDQVRSFFSSLYRNHPVGGLLVWATESTDAKYRGDGVLAPGIVKLLLDGQQRMTTLYGVMRGTPPKFFYGNTKTISGLHFHLESESFEFFQPVKMREDPLWIDVTDLMRKDHDGLGEYMRKEATNKYFGKLSQILSIKNIDLHIEEVTGSDKTLEVVVDIFNRVNSGGTKLSKGDLALAKICAEWPIARERMNKMIETWKDEGYHFTLDWLLRSVNTVLTGEAKFQYLHSKSSEEIQNALDKTKNYINSCLNMIASRIGLDHDRVFFNRYAVPVMVRFLHIHQGHLSAIQNDKILFWFVESGMWGRFSGSVESFIDQDLESLESEEGDPLDNLLEKLRLWHGGLRVEPGHFTGWSLGSRFYPVLYMLTRMGGSRDWGTGGILNAHLLGKMNRLEVHHIFPKSKLYEKKYTRPEVNALANFCFLTKETNLVISNRLPEDYFPEIQQKQPGSLESQWIPNDPFLWKVENFKDFLEERKKLLAAETNRHLAELLHGDTRWLEGPSQVVSEVVHLGGGISSEEEEYEVESLNDWVRDHGLPSGHVSYDFADPETGHHRAIFDMAWPTGLQDSLSQPVAVLLKEGSEVMTLANHAGYRCFTSVEGFKRYVNNEIIQESEG